MKIGVLGGTFDPIHNGHLLIADRVMTQLSLGKVLFVPAGRPWLKENRYISAAEHRMEMVRLAIASRPHFELSAVEVDRDGPSYMVDTIANLQAQLSSSRELYFILGWDNLTNLPCWREPERLIKICCLVAVPRPGYNLPDLASLEKAIPGLSQRVVLLRGPNIGISASDIKERVTRGLSVSHLLPLPVGEYIKQHGLYNL
ncbi:nicotinate-nucleotide adenylyltransferase [Chloroflexota bacterium]